MPVDVSDTITDDGTRDYVVERQKQMQCTKPPLGQLAAAGCSDRRLLELREELHRIQISSGMAPSIE